MSGAIPVRVKVTPNWDEVQLELPPETPLAELKRRALELTLVDDDPGRYLIKYRGALLSDEAKSLAQAGIARNAPLIVLPRRRQPVR